MSLKSRLALLAMSFLLAVPLCGCDNETQLPGVEEGAMAVFCSSVARPAVEQAAQDFEQETGIKISVISGSSGELLERLKEERKGDIYISGSNDFMAGAVRVRVIDTDSVEILAYLVQVIAVQEGNPKNITSLEDLLSSGVRVAIGDPRSVSIGLYAYEIFETNGILDDFRDAGTVVAYADTSEDLAGLLVSKSVDAVIGWDVFAAWHPDDIDIVPIETDMIPRINYIQAALCSFSDNNDAQQFLEYLSSTFGRATFHELGYMLSEDQAREYAPSAEVDQEYRIPDDYVPLV
jgi:molybdate transport system substrate-binding protein